MITIPRVKARKTTYVFKYMRNKDIRESIQPTIDALIRNYFDTDPSKSKATEYRKSEIAAQTIELLWQLFDKLGSWAQDQIAGKLWALENENLAKDIAGLLKHLPLTDHSHLLERLGFACRETNSEYADPILFYLGRKEEELGKEYINHLSKSAKRRLARELLAFRGKESEFWRHELAEALHALDYGQTTEFFTPSSTRRRAEFFQSLTWKCTAICHVNFLIGQGTKKYVALERVGQALNQSPETLRSWEKLLASDEQFAAEMYAARLAGQFEDELKSRTLHELEDEFGDATFRNSSYWYLAREQLGRLKHHYSLERIRDELNEVRRASQKMVRKKGSKSPK